MTDVPRNATLAKAIHRILLTASMTSVAVIAPPVRAAELPTPCVAGSCGAGGPSTWVTSGRATAVTSGNTLTINQSTSRATLNWATFNVSADGRVVFQQPDRSSIALNRIFQQNPSRILGRIDANGEIYLINPNGFVFGSTARVNAAGILASTLKMTDETFTNGLLDPALRLGRRAALNAEPGRVNVLDAAGNPVTGPDGKPLKVQIVIEEGASISTNAAGGRVLLASQQITNAGTIKADDGQVILAAGEKVYLQASEDQELRGLLVEVDTGGKAWNQVTGSLEAARGNVTMVGLAVNQEGRASATTSVAANGSIRLLARDSVDLDNEGHFAATRGGTAELGEHSRTEVLPQLDDSATALDEQEQLKSSVDLMGRHVIIRGGASIVAPSGDVALTALANPKDPQITGPQDTQSRIRVEAGATIDVSGSHSSIPVARNLVTVELRANELADSPLQRNGALRGQTVVVDARASTPLADVSGALQSVPKTVAERTAAGGSVMLNSEGDAVVETGATIDVSGGSVQVEGGQVRTSMVVAADGRIFDISRADPNITYSGVLQPRARVVHDRWGVVEYFDAPSAGRYEPGYTHGYSAGSIQFAAPALVLNGNLIGHATSGEFQRDPSRTPQGGRLRVGREDGGDQPLLDYRAPSIDFSTTRPNIVVGQNGIVPATTTAVLPTDYLTTGGFTRTEIFSNGAVELPSDTPLELAPGSSLQVRANQIVINSAIRNPGGSISFTADATTGANPAGSASGIHIAPGVALDVRGTWTNDGPLDAGPRPTDRVFSDGGSIAMALGANLAPLDSELVIGSQAALLASGGAWLDNQGTLHGGEGGSVKLSANVPGSAVEIGAGVRLEGFGVAGEDGGRFELNAGRVQLVSGAGDWIASERAEFDDVDGGGVSLYSSLFSQHGFTTFDISANGPVAASGDHSNVIVRSGTGIELVARSLMIGPGYTSRPTGGGIEGFSTVELLDELTRPRTDFTLRSLANSTSQRDGIITVESGAAVTADAGSAMNFVSAGGMFIDGTVRTHSGEINLSIPQRRVQFDPSLAIQLGTHSVLDVSGVAALVPSDSPLRQGEVLAAGTINVEAVHGSLAFEPGSLLDVSGTQAVLDLPTSDPSAPYSAQRVASAAGTINLSAAESISMLGQLDAHAGDGDTGRAAGGTLSVTLNRTFATAGDPQFPTSARTVRLAHESERVTAESGLAVLGATSVRDSGIDALNLQAQDRIEADSGVELSLARSLTVDAPAFAMHGEGDATLSAAYVRFGNAHPSNNPQTSMAGAGSLQVEGDLIDIVGTSVLQGIHSAEFASGGDIRLRGAENPTTAIAPGALRTTGDLTLRAERIYPTTLTQFELSAAQRDGEGGRVTFQQQGVSTGTPLSVAGGLDVNAQQIVQAGTLLAPFGSIALKGAESVTLADGSLTSVSGAGQVLPFGSVRNSQEWLYSMANGMPVVQTEIPARRVSIDAPDAETAPTSVIDVSGGGDLYAYEWVPGTGGHRDALAVAQTPGLYAILPSMRDQYGPYDPQEYSGSDLLPGESVYLSGTTGLEAGVYPLLPARYALLPGAFLVSAVNGTQDLQPGAAASLTDGTAVVAGYHTFGNTGIRETRYSGFAVRPGSYGRELAEYTDTLASNFYVDRAARLDLPRPTLPVDAGTLSLSISSSLDALGNVLSSAGTNGRGAGIEVSAPQLDIVAQQTTPVAGIVQLDAGVLDRWHAERLLLGGRTAADGETIDVNARTVTLRDGTSISANEVVIVADESITLDPGARLSSTSGVTGQAPSTPLEESVLALDAGSAGAAVLALSDLQQLLPERGASAGSGQIILSAGSQVSGRGSITIDAPARAALASQFEAAGAAWSLGSSSITLGGAALTTDGIEVSDALLARLQGASSVRLASRDSIDIVGPVSLGLDANSAVQLDRLELEAASIRNLMPDASSVALAGRTLILEGVEGGSALPPATTQGTLQLLADNIVVGPGPMAVAGFAQTLLSANGEIAGEGVGGISASGDLSVASARLTARTGADTQLAAQGAVLLRQTTTPIAELPDVELGGELGISGRDVSLASAIVMPSGLTTLRATNTLDIAAAATIDVSGTSVLAAGEVAHSSGGTIRLQSGGDLNVASTASLAANASGNANAGRMAFAATGKASIAGNVEAAATQGPGGAFELTAGTLDNFQQLSDSLESGGFTERRAIHVQSGDLDMIAGTRASARNVELVTDGGSVRIDGVITAASTADGRGSIRLYGANGVEIGSSAQLLADAADQGKRGGSIELGTSNGAISIASSSVISAVGSEESGTLLLRAPGSAADVAVSSLPSDLSRLGEVVIEAVLPFDVSSIPTTTDLTLIRDTAANYIASAGNTIRTRLGVTSDGVAIRPGVELRSTGDLTLGGDPNVGTDPLDLATWRFDGQPVMLTARAAGNVTIGGIISDGFETLNDTGFDRLHMLDGPSATIRITAGADINSVDPLGTVVGVAGSLFVPTGAVVRTTTGDIELAAADRIEFGPAIDFGGPHAGSVYTGGMAASPTQTTPAQFSLGGSFNFPNGGGSITLVAGGDIVAAPLTQSASAWLPRQGTRDGADEDFATQWGVDFSAFGWNVGALGGGDVDIRSGGSVSSLTAATADSAIESSSGVLDRFGGGALSIYAARDIASNMVYVTGGNGNLRADGGLIQSRQLSSSADPNDLLGSFLLIGDADITIDGRTGVALEGAANPMILTQPVQQELLTFFVTYGSDSSLTVRANGGSTVLRGEAGRIGDYLSIDVADAVTSTMNGYWILPPSLEVSALSGDLLLGGQLALSPADSSRLSLFASRDIGLAQAQGTLEFRMMDAADSVVGTPLLPLKEVSQDVALRTSARHGNDLEPATITAGRDIGGTGTFLLTTAKAAHIRAGRDIIDASFGAENLRPNDITLIDAGRDIRMRSTGNFANRTIFEVDGPGRFDVIAGRQIDLGFSQGIVTNGNVRVPELPEGGADITVIAGLGAPMGANAFADSIIAPSTEYQQQLIDYVEDRFGAVNPSFAEALAIFKAQPIEMQRSLLTDVFFNELVQSGREANRDPELGFDRGYAAIDALFPGSRTRTDSPYFGDLTMALSRIYTVSGGDINLLVPGGMLNVGLATSSGVTKKPSELGIVAQGEGDVRVFTRDDVLVNSSRIFTLFGGDIAIWSTLGNIDAGRGSKSAISAPSPTIVVDAAGRVTIDFVGAVSGSGIRTILTGDVDPGDVDLIAPVGFVNAGDAGIGSAGNLNIAAQQVVGLDNIQVGGVSTGVPAETSGLGASLAGVSAAASSSSKASTDSVGAEDGDKASSQSLAQAALSWLEVFVVGLGEEGCKQDDMDCLKRQKTP